MIGLMKSRSKRALQRMKKQDKQDSLGGATLATSIGDMEEAEERTDTIALEPPQSPIGRKRSGLSKDDSKGSVISLQSVSEHSSNEHGMVRELSFKRHIQVEEESNEILEFYLKRRTPGRCNSGMEWQQDPRKKKLLLHPHRNAPLDYATIRGTVIYHEGHKWLVAKEMRQASSDRWHKAPPGAALPFFYKREYCLMRQRNSGSSLARKNSKSGDDSGDDNSVSSARSARSWREEAVLGSRQFSARSLGRQLSGRSLCIDDLSDTLEDNSVTLEDLEDL